MSGKLSASADRGSEQIIAHSLGAHCCTFQLAAGADDCLAPVTHHIRDERALTQDLQSTGACSGQLLLSNLHSRRRSHSCTAGSGWDPNWRSGRSGIRGCTRQCRRQCWCGIKQGLGLDEGCRTHPCRGQGEGQQIDSNTQAGMVLEPAALHATWQVSTRGCSSLPVQQTTFV